MKTLLPTTILLTLLPLLITTITPTTADAETYPRTIDGDTIEIPITQVKDFPKTISIRLMGINTPETTRAQCTEERKLGLKAKQFVKQTLEQAKRIEYQFIQWDKYGGRADGRIIIDGVDLSDLLLTNKLAQPYNGGTKTNPWCKKPR